ncbi:DUF2264 domain-containing protein, partial [Escherichia coli]|nr:DUF2264 domain-containing protein [Escherichia coli]
MGLNQQSFNLPLMIKQSFIHGTDPFHKGYWGKLEDYDQRICEASDLALTLWISREWVWDTLTPASQQQIMTWFEQVNHCEIVDNNWHFFPLTVQFVIKALTGK